MGEKTAVILGGTGGIGSAIAKKLTAKGISVYASCHNKQPSDTDGQGITYFQADISDGQSVAHAFSTILSERAIDIVVFSVTAKIKNRPFLTLTWEDYAEHIKVQVRGLFYAASALKEQLRTKHRTRFIILLTEYCVGKPPASLSHYVTAKYGLMGLAKSMAVDLTRYNCTVNMVSPGLTSTELIADLPPKLIEIAQESNPLKRIATPEDVANVVMFLAGEESDYLNGANILVNGGGVMQ
jgi:3-oxoacyl-[acyl-carrier protein] reductase